MEFLFVYSHSNVFVFVDPNSSISVTIRNLKFFFLTITDSNNPKIFTFLLESPCM